MNYIWSGYNDFPFPKKPLPAPVTMSDDELQIISAVHMGTIIKIDKSHL